MNDSPIHHTQEGYRARVERALDTPPVRDAFANCRVTIAVPDATRAIPHDATLAPLLERLRDVGAHPTVIVALGLHRPMTASELAPLAELTRYFGAPLIQSAPHDSDKLVCVDEDVGYALEGIDTALPAIFSRAVVETDRLVCTGLVEPHQYAGFSGGVKTIAIGCAGAETISALHGLPYLRHDATRLGEMQHNPFRRALRRVVARLPPIDALQVVPIPNDPFITWGEASDALERAAAIASTRLFREYEHAADWAALSVPEAKSQSFYQASRAATYVALVERPVVREGGWLLIEAACGEGVGDGSGEEACERALARGLAMLREELDDVVLNKALRGGEQRAYVIAKVLETFRVALVGAPKIDVLERIGVPQFDTREDAIDALGLDPSGGHIIEDAFHAVPVLAGVI